MAVAAGEFRMMAFEREVRVACMVEARIFPAGRIVAIAALLAALAVMCIVLRMAAVTRRRRVLEGLVRMAVETARLQVFADERIARVGVIKFHVLPTRRRMAIAACRAERTLVHVIVGMAVGTGIGRIAEFDAGLVTRFASRLRMLAQQREVRQRVIEGPLVQVHDVCVSPDVIGMTGLTGILAGLVGQAVETGVGVDVLSDVVMTVETQHSLFPPFEFLMTFIAVLLDIRMTLNEISRHDQGLDLRVGGCCDQKRGDHHDSGYPKTTCHASADLTDQYMCTAST